MDAMTALLTRQSSGKLAEPGPTPAQWALICQAALRAPDHVRLRPWRFLVVRGESRRQLGELFAGLQQRDEPGIDADSLEKTRRKALRAPLLVVAIARITEHPKVPAEEQLLSAGCAVHAMLLAAHAQGLGGIWRTGALARDPRLHEALGLLPGETIAGFLYLGTPVQPVTATQRPDPAGYFRDWP